MGTSHAESHRSYTSSRRAAALPSSARKYGRGQVHSILMAALLISAVQSRSALPTRMGGCIPLGAAAQRGSEPQGRESHMPYTTELYRTIRLLPNPRPAANRAVL